MITPFRSFRFFGAVAGPLAALTMTITACSSAPRSPSVDTSDQQVRGAASTTCSADPPTNAVCAPCANGYAIGTGSPTCACCAPDAGKPSDPTAPPACCDPGAKPKGDFIEGISCCADAAWHESFGGGESHTCSPFGGVGEVCGASPSEICGGPPPNGFCAACPGGVNGYKQIDGAPTCECCTTLDNGKRP